MFFFSNHGHFSIWKNTNFSSKKTPKEAFIRKTFSEQLTNECAIIERENSQSLEARYMNILGSQRPSIRETETKGPS